MDGKLNQKFMTNSTAKRKLFFVRKIMFPKEGKQSRVVQIKWRTRFEGKIQVDEVGSRKVEFPISEPNHSINADARKDK